MPGSTGRKINHVFYSLCYQFPTKYYVLEAQNKSTVTDFGFKQFNQGNNLQKKQVGTEVSK